MRILVVAIFVAFLVAILIKSSHDREKVEMFVVGSWSHEPPDMFEDHLVIHIWPDHTYTQESPNYHDAKEGTWHISAFPMRSQLSLSSLHHFTDTSSDGDFEIDQSRRTMTDRYRSNQFKKLSQNPELPVSDAEKAILGAWDSSVEQVHNYVEHTFLFSDHSYEKVFESSGSWRLVGKQLTIEATDKESGKSQESELSVDAAKGRLKYTSEGYSLHRPPPIVVTAVPMR